MKMIRKDTERGGRIALRIVSSYGQFVPLPHVELHAVVRANQNVVHSFTTSHSSNIYFFL